MCGGVPHLFCGNWLVFVPLLVFVSVFVFASVFIGVAETGFYLCLCQYLYLCLYLLLFFFCQLLEWQCQSVAGCHIYFAETNLATSFCWLPRTTPKLFPDIHNCFSQIQVQLQIRIQMQLQIQIQSQIQISETKNNWVFLQCQPNRVSVVERIDFQQRNTRLC